MPSSQSAPTLSDVQRLLQAYRNHLTAAQRHNADAALIETQLRKLLPEESPLLDLMSGEGARN